MSKSQMAVHLTQSILHTPEFEGCDPGELMAATLLLSEGDLPDCPVAMLRFLRDYLPRTAGLLAAE